MRKPHAFTLVELLVVIAIITLLIAILLPSLAQARATAKRTVCLTHARGLSQSLHLYISDWNSLIPYGLATSGLTYMWADPLSNYGNSDKLRQCPEALDQITSTSQSQGSATTSWNYSANLDMALKRLVYARGGFALNGWLFTGVSPAYTYMTPGDEDANFIDQDDAGQTFTNQSTSVTVYLGTGYSLTRARTSPNIPTFADSIWSEVFPTPSDLVPADLTLGSMDIADEMGRVCITRHHKTINVAFFDDHAENVPLQSLWTLAWKPGWVPPNPPRVIP